jgi:hypothetical protein
MTYWLISVKEKKEILVHSKRINKEILIERNKTVDFDAASEGLLDVYQVMIRQEEEKGGGSKNIYSRK